MYEAFLNQPNGTMYLVMELLQGSNMRVLMEEKGVRFEEHEAKVIFR